MLPRLLNTPQTFGMGKPMRWFEIAYLGLVLWWLIPLFLLLLLFIYGWVELTDRIASFWWKDRSGEPDNY